MLANANVNWTPTIDVFFLLATLFSGYGFQLNYNSTQPVNSVLVGNERTVILNPLMDETAETRQQAKEVTVGTKFTLDETRYPNAKCLDGTQGAYYFSQGSGSGAHKWYIFKQGGGFCNSILDCHKRSRSNLGSSSLLMGWLDELSMDSDEGDPHMGFSRDFHKNPLMYNWNFVFVIYCDGAYFAGNNLSKTMTGPFGLTEIHFKGAHIMAGVIDHLQGKFFAEASDIVVGGCSAGGISTINTADWIKTLVDRVAPNAKFAGFSCSGFFLDYDYTHSLYTTKKYFPFHHSNLSGTLSPECLETYSDIPHKCLVSHVSATFTKTPMFLWESLYDKYMLENVLQEPCEDASCANPHGQNIRLALYNLWHMKADFGGYLSGCSHHCEDSEIGSISNLQPVGGVYPLQAMAFWYNAFVKPITAESKQRYWQENRPYPCIECCPPESGRVMKRHPLHDDFE